MTDSVAFYAYLFEAKGIQRYILDSGPLRDLVGASDLVAGVAASDGEDLLAPVLVRCGISSDALSRRASGAFMVHSSKREPLDRLRALWRLTAGLRYPGLEMSDVLLDDITAAEADGAVGAMQSAYDSRSAITFNSAAELPPTGHPFASFNRRTGRLTTALHFYANASAGDVVPVDIVTETQRDRADRLQGKLDGVARKFLPDGEETDDKGREYVFPRNLDPREGDTPKNPLFPFRRRSGAAKGDVDRRIAVVHADISGLGQTFQAVRKNARAPQEVFAEAERIETMVVAAVRAASKPWLLEHAKPRDERNQAVLPARPIVLGGDDITVILRADIALPFTQRLLEEIEMHGDGLSACAGIALVRVGQPFLMVRSLADDLCKFAKKTAKANERPYPSLVAFHNGGSTLRESYDRAYRREMTSADEAVVLTGNPYALGDRPTRATRLEHLIELAKALHDAPGSGNLVAAAQLLFEDRDRAGEVWTRWRRVLGDQDAHRLCKVDAALEVAGFVIDKSDPGAAWPFVVGLISDALEWIDFGLVDALTTKPSSSPASASAAA